MHRMNISYLTQQQAGDGDLHKKTVSTHPPKYFGEQQAPAMAAATGSWDPCYSPGSMMPSSHRLVHSPSDPADLGLALLAGATVNSMPRAPRARARARAKTIKAANALPSPAQIDFTPNRTVDALTRGAKDLSPLQADHKKRTNGPNGSGASPGFDRLMPVPRVQRYNTRSALKNQLNGQLLVNAPLPSGLVAKLLETIYEEVENDDREMYRLDRHILKEQTKCSRSDLVDTLDSGEFVRMLTYGEVSVASITSTVLPLLDLQHNDVFYDLGCGTGKIVVQAALETPCCVAKGIELMQNRVHQGTKALQRLQRNHAEYAGDKVITIVQGDILCPPPEADMRDATVVFINNVCFGPELMFQLMRMLNDMKQIRRLVTLRKICERHRQEKCLRAGSCCINFKHPPTEQQINVSWAHKTSVYLYERREHSPTQPPSQPQSPQQQQQQAEEEAKQFMEQQALMYKQQSVKERFAQQRAHARLA